MLAGAPDRALEAAPKDPSGSGNDIESDPGA